VDRDLKHHTVTTTLDTPPDEVFAYLADIEKLPEWATEFARELRLVDGRHKVVNGLGEFFFEIHADAQSGVIDMVAGPSEDALLCFPTRVVATPSGGSAYTFTMFQAPGQPDEQFETQHASLLRELENLQQRLDSTMQTGTRYDGSSRADVTDEFPSSRGLEAVRCPKDLT
jgi:hypothetical protein